MRRVEIEIPRRRHNTIDLRDLPRARVEAQLGSDLVPRAGREGGELGERGAGLRVVDVARVRDRDRLVEEQALCDGGWRVVLDEGCVGGEEGR